MQPGRLLQLHAPQAHQPGPAAPPVRALQVTEPVSPATTGQPQPQPLSRPGQGPQPPGRPGPAAQPQPGPAAESQPGQGDGQGACERKGHDWCV